MQRWLMHAACAGLAASLLFAANIAMAAETVVFGHVGGPSPVIWPIHIGMATGLFEKEGVTLDVVYSQSSAAVQQQIAAGSMDIGDSGVVDPIRAIVRGAPVAILSIEGDTAPYALYAKPGIKSRRELAGKKISVAGGKDITRLYVERMLAAEGVKADQVDFLYAGSTAARLAALQSGAVDAAILTAPAIFRADDAGFTNLGLAVDFARDMPFTAYSVNRNAARAKPAAVRGFLAGSVKSVAWFYDLANREAAIKILIGAMKVSREDAARSYDFLHKINFFARDAKVSTSRLAKVIEVLQQLGDLEGPVPVDRLILPGVTEVDR